MKILKTVPVDRIPEKLIGVGRKRSSKYDTLVEKILSLPDGKSLPLECETIAELNTLRTVIKKRSDRIALTARGLILYASKAQV